MDVEQELWSLPDLIGQRAQINLNPMWQRGPTWRPPRQVLLVDSILRGMDIPKLYLRVMGAAAGHAYDAVDGQQRLRAILAFVDGDLTLEHPEGLAPIDGIAVEGLVWATLPKLLKDRFEGFCVSVALVSGASNDDITSLFARLQLGVPLNPAELRNAILGPLRHAIDTMWRTHEFFSECRINDRRYNHMDYATHVFAMAAYNGARDIKAPDLRAMVRDYGADRMEEVLDITRKVGEALSVLAEVNRLAGGRIRQKWMFVDLAWYVMQEHDAGRVVDPEAVAVSYLEFETARRANNQRPEELIRGRPTVVKRRLYRYIMAFKTQGATRQNLVARNETLRPFLDVGQGA
ncbi:MAG: DUF262 domain-containing protein [Caulobacter sp.]|nr:DUF262 domain-containing protein [Caulobacter sp.]